MTAIDFTILHRSAECAARLGRVETPHGGFDTPAFMPVATAAAMKGLTPAQVRSTGSQIILNNAYHLLVRPGPEIVAHFGGAHRFMRWDGPILTDSGGFQAWSMSDTAKLDDDGVTFRSFVDGSRIHMGPERSMEVQNQIGADIIMAFDDCPPSVDTPESMTRIVAGHLRRPAKPADHAKRLEEAHERTLRWLARCVKAHRRPEAQALFGIVQGGTDLDLRRRSVEGVCAVDLPGYAIGGVAVGEGTEEIRRVVEFTAPLLPEGRPRYLMGVGYERDILAAVRAGVDMFDCVLPTRNGRNALAFTRTGPIRLRNAKFRLDDGPIDPKCACPVCRGPAGAPLKGAAEGSAGGSSGGPARWTDGPGGFSRGYLRHLFAAEEMLGPTLVSLHNVAHFQSLLLDIRRAIRQDAWSLLVQEWPVLAAGPASMPDAEFESAPTPPSG